MGGIACASDGDIDTASARRLLVAVILRAVYDAQGIGPRVSKRMMKQARAWLARDGAALADALDIAHPGTVRAWAARPAPALATRAAALGRAGCCGRVALPNPKN
jgi:hypothetical protein